MRLRLGLVTVAVSCLALCAAHAQRKDRSRSIEFSVPRSDEVTTNLHQLTSKKDSLRQLEEELNSPLRLFAPKNSLEGVTAPLQRPPAGPVIQNKRVKELLERRKDWMFMSPEDLVRGPTLEQILKAPKYEANGQEKKDLAPMERYYDNLAKRRGLNKLGQSGNEDLFAPNSTKPREQAAPSDDSDLPSNLREKAQALKQLSATGGGTDVFGQREPRNRFSDTFGLEEIAPSKEQTLARQKYRDEYQTLLDPSWKPPTPAGAANPLFGLKDAVPPAANVAAGLGGLPSVTTHRGMDAQIDITHPLLGPAPLPDVNARALGQPRTLPTLTKVEPPKVGVPIFEAPKRSF